MYTGSVVYDFINRSTQLADGVTETIIKCVDISLRNVSFHGDKMADWIVFTGLSYP